MANIPIRDIPGAVQTAPSPNALLAMDNGTSMEKTTVQAITDSGAPVASKSEAEAGTDNTKRMTALRVKESIAAEVGQTIASADQGTKADSAVQPSRTISAGTGLVGGGDLSANRSFALSSTALASLALADTAVQPARAITAGAGLSGGGSLAADRTIALSTATQASLALADSAVQPSRTINTGTGLTGGGGLSADLTIALTSAAIASLDKADTAVQTVNGYPADAYGNVVVDAAFLQEQDSRAAASIVSFAPTTQWVRTAGYAAPGDVGGALYKRAASEPSHAGKFQSADGAWWELANEVVSVKMLGAKGDGSTDDTAAINDALEALVAKGGGILYFPPGEYVVSNYNPSTTTWDNEVAIHVLHSNVHLVGAGRGATKLRLADDGRAFLVKFGRRWEGIVTVDNCSISGMTLDGNRENQPLPTDTDDHWCGVFAASNCTRITMRDLNIVNMVYYGIGFGREGNSGCLVEDVFVANTGADGIDTKNDDSSGHSNVIRNATVINYGMFLGHSLAQAGIDLRSGWSAINCHVQMGDGPNARGIRTLGDGDASNMDIPPHPIKILDCSVKGKGATNSVAFEIATRATICSNPYADNVDIAYSVRRNDSQIVNPVAVGVKRGIFLHQDGSTVLEADNCTILGGLIRASDNGVYINSVDSVSLMGTHIRGSGTGTGITITSGSDGVRIYGGSCTGWATQLADSGTGTVIRGVHGLTTQSVTTANVPIDSTGPKSFSIAHGLAVTPDYRDVDLQLRRNTNVGDFAIGALWVTNTDATNVYGQMIVTTASATSGAVVDVVVRSKVKDG